MSMTMTAKADVALAPRPCFATLDVGGCEEIVSSAGMAALLFAAAPERSRAFAVAMHERACAGYDVAHTDFWREVLTWLAYRAALTTGR